MTARALQANMIARLAAGAVAQLAAGEAARADINPARFWEHLAAHLATHLPRPREAPIKRPAREKTGHDWEDAVEQCDRVLEKLEDMPTAGQDFADSVREKVEGIRESILKFENATTGQYAALDNMEEATDKWINPR